jgi:preprotein translocase subunit SecD
MIDFILAGLSAGLLAFLALFIISFVTLGLITGVIHLVTLVYRSLVFGKTPTYEDQAA